MTERRGRADLHIHTRASDGLATVTEVLDAAVAAGDLDVIAIADHDRIDAAVAARQAAIDRGLPFEVIVGEEITTLGGHLVGLFLERRVPPVRSLRWTIEAVHDQGGIAIPAHPLVPYPLCAQGFVLRRLLDDPRARPDALETFNPTPLGRFWHGRVVRFAANHGLAQIGNSDAHTVEAIGAGFTSFPGRTGEDLRRAIAAGETRHHGAFHTTLGQVGVFGQQLRKYRRDIRDELRRRRGVGTGKDRGIPGGERS
jgi:predicted metal-dependent phosphoesterase TrpH